MITAIGSQSLLKINAQIIGKNKNNTSKNTERIPPRTARIILPINELSNKYSIAIEVNSLNNFLTVNNSGDRTQLNYNGIAKY